MIRREHHQIEERSTSFHQPLFPLRILQAELIHGYHPRPGQAECPVEVHCILDGGASQHPDQLLLQPFKEPVRAGLLFIPSRCLPFPVAAVMGAASTTFCLAGCQGERHHEHQRAEMGVAPQAPLPPGLHPFQYERAGAPLRPGRLPEDGIG